MTYAKGMSWRRIGIEEARGKLGDLVTLAYRDGEITILTSHRMDAAAIVPLGRITDPPPPDLPIENID